VTADQMSVAEAHANAMREARARQLAQAVANYRKAEDDLKAAREAERTAHTIKSHAYQKLRELMEGDVTKVVGDMLLSVNPHGGVEIRKVEVLPLTGVQTCLL
jgi:uncharacterized protein involved in exopolysaccharide biosynthesis